VHAEITRMVAGWLAHPNFGVNTLAAAVPRKNLKGAQDKAPPKVTIYTDVDNDIASVSGVDPPSVPALVVVSDIDLRAAEFPEKRPLIQVSAIAGIGYYDDETTRAEIVRRGNYILRAVLRSMYQYHLSPARSADYRLLNEVRIARVTGLTMSKAAGAIPTSRLLGLVFVDLEVHDMKP
jgi:hypothetical protein